MSICIHTTPDTLRGFIPDGEKCSGTLYIAMCNTWCEHCGRWVCSYIGPCKETALWSAELLPGTAWVSRGRINRDVAFGRFLPSGLHVVEMAPDMPHFFSCETINVREVA